MTNPVSMEETMSSTASLITLLASVAFGLIVIAAIMRVENVLPDELLSEWAQIRPAKSTIGRERRVLRVTFLWRL